MNLLLLKLLLVWQLTNYNFAHLQPLLA